MRQRACCNALARARSSSARAAHIACEGGGTFEFMLRLLMPPDLGQRSPRTLGQMIGLQRRLRNERIRQFETSMRTVRHPHRDGAIQLHNR